MNCHLITMRAKTMVMGTAEGSSKRNKDKSNRTGLIKELLVDEQLKSGSNRWSLERLFIDPDPEEAR